MPVVSMTHVQRELHFLEQMLEEYPHAACHGARDPHVERLIQACALLAARIHTRLDDEFPEITEALFSLLSPHSLAPLPAMSVAQCVLNPGQGKHTHGYTLAAGTMLTAKQDIRGVTCRLQTCYPVTLWPLQVVAASLGEPDVRTSSLQGQPAQAMLTLTLRCTDGLTFPELRLKHLRVYLHGNLPLAATLYETLFCHTYQVQLHAPKAQGAQHTVYLSPRCLHPVGFGQDEGMLPYSPLSFLGYRLLQEYCTFPQKFLFLDVYELERAVQAGCEDTLDIRFMLRQQPRLAHPIDPQHFRLGCTPIVNVFPQRAEPIRLDHRQSEYQVIPDVTHQDGMEVYAINAVTSMPGYQAEPVCYAPFYAFKHAAARKPRHAFWQAVRRASPRQDDAGTDVFLRLIDLDFQATVPSVDTLIVKTTCTNRDRTRELPVGNPGGDFDLEGQQEVATICALDRCTDPIRIPLRQSLHWRLIAHLGLNYVSVYDAGLEALQEILTLHDVANANQRHIAGITALQRQQVVRRLASIDQHSFCAGIEVTLQCDEAAYAPGELFLFASVLERFFGLCAPINSFSQLVVTTDQRLAQQQEPLHLWLPRAGEQVLRT